MKNFRLFAFKTIALFLFAILSIAPAYADSPAPQKDYTLSVGDGKYIFVMLSIPNDQSAFGQGGAVQDAKIRTMYKKSGLYTTDDVPKALWTVDWYAFQVDISADGMHLVRWGPWASKYTEIAVEFYTNGSLTRSYQVNDLVHKPENLPHSVSHFSWRRAADFNSDQKELFIETNNGEQYFFDVSTGLLLNETLTPEPWTIENSIPLLLKIIGSLGILAILVTGSVQVFKYDLPKRA